MDLDFIYSSLVADKMSREDWGGCGCSPAAFASIVIISLMGYGSGAAYTWAERIVLGVVPYGEADFKVIVARVAIICLIVVFWALLFVLLWNYAPKKAEEEGNDEEDND